MKQMNEMYIDKKINACSLELLTVANHIISIYIPKCAHVQLHLHNIQVYKLRFLRLTASLQSPPCLSPRILTALQTSK